MRRQGVHLGIHSNGVDAMVLAGADHTTGNLTTVCNQNLGCWQLKGALAVAGERGCAVGGKTIGCCCFSGCRRRLEIKGRCKGKMERTENEGDVRALE